LLSRHGDAAGVARRSCPPSPGLYAIHADRSIWQKLEVDDGWPDGRPLYVGKAQRSLARRDVGTHFQTGKTGWSTVRRSLASMLRAELKLRARPRKVEEFGSYDCFGLEPAGDERLTVWMHEHLRLALAPVVSSDLTSVERAVLHIPDHLST
jgi:hypothetical protein